MQAKENLLGYSLESLESFFSKINEPKFRAKQLLKWIHQKGVLDFNLMTDLNKDLRAKLNSIAYIKPPIIHEEHISKEGTIKYLIALESGSMIEMVEIPEKIEELYVSLLKLVALFNALFVLPVPRGSIKT